MAVKKSTCAVEGGYFFTFVYTGKIKLPDYEEKVA